MKQLAVLLVLICTTGAWAQRHEGHRGEKPPMMDLTAEQLAILKTKRMTLALDLNKSQQAKVKNIVLEEAQYRKAKIAQIQAKKENGEWKQPTVDERFAYENARLDRQIVHQQKMKEILTQEQYQTWKKLKLRKEMNGKKKMQGKGRRG